MAGRLTAEQEEYLRLLGIPPPPPITPDMPPEVVSYIEMVTAALIAAANMGDPADMTEAERGHAERTALATDAATKFPANEEAQATGMQDTMSMAQQIPQIASSIAGAVSGALGGALQPLTQLPQGLAQTAQQLMQSTMGAFDKAGADELSPDAWDTEGLADDIGAGGAGDLGGAGGAGAGTGGIGTTPMAMLGPPATPSPTTTPAAGRVAAPPVVSATTAPAPGPMGGMGPMPMMPPGVGRGADSNDEQTATKRVSVPAIKNGAPVQGRVTTPLPPVVKSTGDVKPTTRRRIVIPSDKADDRLDTRNDG
jgi:hypothetical protein